jgi:hypothetical protein
VREKFVRRLFWRSATDRLAIVAPLYRPSKFELTI